MKRFILAIGILTALAWPSVMYACNVASVASVAVCPQTVSVAQVTPVCCTTQQTVFQTVPVQTSLIQYQPMVQQQQVQQQVQTVETPPAVQQSYSVQSVQPMVQAVQPYVQQQQVAVQQVQPYVRQQVVQQRVVRQRQVEVRAVQPYVASLAVVSPEIVVQRRSILSPLVVRQRAVVAVQVPAVAQVEVVQPYTYSGQGANFGRGGRGSLGGGRGGLLGGGRGGRGGR